MRGGIGRRLEAVAIFLAIFAVFFVAFAGVAPGEAGARASLRAYMTTGPNTWEMMGFNATGTAASFIVDHQGWNVSRTFGNVGIGDGSARALNMSSNVNDIGYTEKYFMAGDVSMAPWDPSRITDYSVSKENLPEETPRENTTKSVAGQEQKDIAGEGAVPKKEVAGNKTSEVSFGETARNMALNDPFHTILLGRPVGDVWYEHPHAISANMYARLIGVRVPGGSVANVGMRAIGYGF